MYEQGLNPKAQGLGKGPGGSLGGSPGGSRSKVGARRAHSPTLTAASVPLSHGEWGSCPHSFHVWHIWPHLSLNIVSPSLPYFQTFWQLVVNCLCQMLLLCPPLTSEILTLGLIVLSRGHLTMSGDSFVTPGDGWVLLHLRSRSQGCFSTPHNSQATLCNSYLFYNLTHAVVEKLWLNCCCLMVFTSRSFIPLTHILSLGHLFGLWVISSAATEDKYIFILMVLESLSPARFLFWAPNSYITTWLDIFSLITYRQPFGFCFGLPFFNLRKKKMFLSEKLVCDTQLSVFNKRELQWTVILKE